MATNTSGAASNCIFYFVHLDSEQHPIPSTMFAKLGDNSIDPDYKCNIARLPATQMTIPAGNVRCIDNTTHMRYFYKVNSQNGQILPNSMFQMMGKPSQMCQGVYNILEYIIIKPAP